MIRIPGEGGPRNLQSDKCRSQQLLEGREGRNQTIKPSNVREEWIERGSDCLIIVLHDDRNVLVYLHSRGKERREKAFRKSTHPLDLMLLMELLFLFSRVVCR